jgi:ubiquinone/menaquinone biosynthesis C-methylase UbiE
MSQLPSPESIARVTRSRAQARATYSRISKWYDLLEGVWETQARNSGLQKLDVTAGESVLEIGVGTGHAAMALAQSVGQTGHVYGLDLAGGMLHVTRSRIEKKQRLAGKIVLMQGDAVGVPFAANSIDAIFMSFVLELFDTPEIPQVLAQCRRVLSPRGRLSIVSLSKTGKTALLRNLYEWGHRQFPQVLDCRPIFVQQALEDSGFKIVEANLISLWGLPVEIVLAAA